MKYDAFLGIDPGKSGGVAVVAGEYAIAYKIPESDKDLFDLIVDITSQHKIFAVIEKVHSSPQMGVRSAFTFGEGKGKLLMCLTAIGLPFEQVTPSVWQRSLSCLSKGDKNVTKIKAQQLFPELKITHATADALLIAEYARRVHSG